MKDTVSEESWRQIVGEGQSWKLRARESRRKYNNANASHCDTNAKRGSACECVPVCVSVYVCVCVLYKGVYATALYLLRSLPRRDWKLINKAILISANLICSCSCCCLFYEIYVKTINIFIGQANADNSWGWVRVWVVCVVRVQGIRHVVGAAGHKQSRSNDSPTNSCPWPQWQQLNNLLVYKLNYLHTHTHTYILCTCVRMYVAGSRARGAKTKGKHKLLHAI